MKVLRTAFSISLLNLFLYLILYLTDTSILFTLFNFTDLHIETALLENAVEKFNL